MLTISLPWLVQFQWKLSEAVLLILYTFFKADSSGHTKLYFNTEQAVYLLIPIIVHSHKLPWSLRLYETRHWFCSNICKLYHCILLQ